MDIALCNPPFGAKTLENRKYILKNYDLGYQWVQQDGKWIKTETILDNQQIGILFIERCFKLLVEGGRMGIILPEGYLCTASYGYVREWIISKFKIIGLVELPRRIFLKSDADLRSNILFAIKENVQGANYPVHAELVRKVGYKLGKGFFPIFLRDNESGLEKRDEKNNPIIDTDFERVKNNFTAFLKMVNDTRIENWTGAYKGATGSQCNQGACQYPVASGHDDPCQQHDGEWEQEMRLERAKPEADTRHEWPRGMQTQK